MAHDLCIIVVINQSMGIWHNMAQGRKAPMFLGKVRTKESGGFTEN